MKKNWLKNIFRGFCLTSAVFVFQACYGSPQDFGKGIRVSGVVKSKKTGKPIPGIMISLGLTSPNHSKELYDVMENDITDEYGRYALFTYETDKMLISFEDVDEDDGKDYIRMDTVLTVKNSSMVLNVELVEK